MHRGSPRGKKRAGDFGMIESGDGGVGRPKLAGRTMLGNRCQHNLLSPTPAYR